MNAVNTEKNLQPFVAQFLSAASPNGSASLPGWLAELRKNAYDKLSTLSLPSVRDEEWRFTKLKALYDTPLSTTAKVDVSDSLKAEIQGLRLDEASEHTLVFVNGVFFPELSAIENLPKDVVVSTWSELLKNGDADFARDHLAHNRYFDNDLFWTLNTALFNDGVVIMVPRNTVIDAPIQLLFVGANGSDAYFAQARNLIVAGESSQFSVVENYYGSEGASYFHNIVNDISLGANSHIKHYKVQREDENNGFHIARTLVNLASDSHFNSTALTFGGRISRNDTYALYEGQNIDCTLDGLAFVHGKQVADTHTAIDHAKPNSRSNQVHKCIIDGSATTVFNGKIFVRKDAQVTRSEQLNQNLLLSNKATANTKPQLEILADDVICSHGATVGQLEDEQLFYLQSRGLDANSAKNLLTFAFAADLMEGMSIVSLKQSLEDLIMSRANKG